MNSFDVEDVPSAQGTAVSLTTGVDKGAPPPAMVCSALCTTYLVAFIAGIFLVHVAPATQDFALHSDPGSHSQCDACKGSTVLDASFVNPMGQRMTCVEGARHCSNVQQCAEGRATCDHIQMYFMFVAKCCSNVTIPKLTPGRLSLAINFALERQKQLESATFVFLAFLAVVGCTFTSSLLVVFSPLETPPDFHKKGTLSNVSQDVSKPHGRLFAVSLFSAGMLTIFSMYTFWLYRPWMTRVNFEYLPFLPPRSIFERQAERSWRTTWVVAPQVGLMFTAAIPSMSDTAGYQLAMTMVHNVFAPISMMFLLIMETVQLSFGESAFSHFFSSEPVAVFYGTLSSFQRWRVVIATYSWIAIGVFLGVQIYFGLGDVLGIKINPTYTKALISFFSEVTLMCLIAALPAIAGAEMYTWNHMKGPVLDETLDSVLHGPWGPWPPINISH